MKNLSSLIYSTYFQSYLKAEDLVYALTDAPTLSPDSLHSLGYHTVLANELRPVMDVISHVEYFVDLFEDPIHSRKYLVKQVLDLQECIRVNQNVITPSLPTRIEAAMQNAKGMVHSPVDKHKRITLFDLEPDEPYEYSGDMINDCFKNAPKANMQHIPVLLSHIQALNQLDTNLPFKELRSQAKSLFKQLSQIS